MKPITTTLKEIRRHRPCQPGWQRLLSHLGKTKPDDEPLSLITILESNGFGHAIWCLRALPESEHWRVRLFTVACANQVKHLMTDERSLNALRVSKAYALGFASRIEFVTASEEAWDGAWGAAWHASWVADWTANWTADWEAARSKQETLFKAYFGSPLPKEHYIEQYTK